MNPEKLSWTTISTETKQHNENCWYVNPIEAKGATETLQRGIYYCQFYEYCAYACQDLGGYMEWKSSNSTGKVQLESTVKNTNTTDLSSHQFYSVRDLDANRLALKKTCKVEDKHLFNLDKQFSEVYRQSSCFNGEWLFAQNKVCW